MTIRILCTLYQANSAKEAAEYAASLANRPDYARLCLLQTAGGAWTVCLTARPD
ncbi:hypothetical protein L4G92_00215 [Neisseria sp. ZJ106]|uniref:Uncharacterized protein n=1 Tax=Neisseria lisongii TaxID=2912188 RepID=A0AAW5ASE5_9NEIS|nr:hypothetical protein [Neisseria lisongii]MCF7520481.1 hypothetical protein [Neisseria lisongii]MCF7530318.1 hypothetical protein [Neisseria lisongii]WCL71577.1 hypothetical protein PJU73_00145 [Neisseria lisongii]